MATKTKTSDPIAALLAAITSDPEALAKVTEALSGKTKETEKSSDPFAAYVKSVEVTFRDGSKAKTWDDMSKVLAKLGGKTELTAPAHGLITGGQLTALRNRLRSAKS